MLSPISPSGCRLTLDCGAPRALPSQRQRLTPLRDRLSCQRPHHRRFRSPKLPEVRMQITCRVAIACSTSLLLAGCAKSDQAAKDSAAAAAATAAPAPAPATPAPAPALSLADVAGKWQVRSVPESGTDTTSTNYVLTATADTTGWFITFPSGLKVPLHVM